MIFTLKVIGLLFMFLIGYVFLQGLLSAYEEDREKVSAKPFLGAVWMLACIFLMLFPIVYTINGIMMAILT